MSGMYVKNKSLMWKDGEGEPDLRKDGCSGTGYVRDGCE
jgi:hypothetical protein